MLARCDKVVEITIFKEEALVFGQDICLTCELIMEFHDAEIINRRHKLMTRIETDLSSMTL